MGYIDVTSLVSKRKSIYETMIEALEDRIHEGLLSFENSCREDLTDLFALLRIPEGHENCAICYLRVVYMIKKIFHAIMRLKYPEHFVRLEFPKYMSLDVKVHIISPIEKLEIQIGTE